MLEWLDGEDRGWPSRVEVLENERLCFRGVRPSSLALLSPWDSLLASVWVGSKLPWSSEDKENVERSTG